MALASAALKAFVNSATSPRRTASSCSREAGLVRGGAAGASWGPASAPPDTPTVAASKQSTVRTGARFIGVDLILARLEAIAGRVGVRSRDPESSPLPGDGREISRSSSRVGFRLRVESLYHGLQALNQQSSYRLDQAVNQTPPDRKKW